MRAILLKDFGGPENLYLGKVPDPKPQRNEVLVEIKATALNRADIMQRQGNYPPPPGTSDILGLEMAGIVIETGSHESKWKIGDRVFGLLSGGGYAEQVVTHESMLMPIPNSLSWEEAAGIAEVFLTAHQALFWLADLQQREKVCIHAGASGVGTAAIQLAGLQRSEIFVTASDSKHEICRSLGAHHTIDYQAENFKEVILGQTDGVGVDVVLDFIAAPYFNWNLDILAIDGRLIMLSLIGGSKVSEFNLAKILRKRLKIIGSTLRSRSLAYKINLTQSFFQSHMHYFDQGIVKPIIDSIYSWHDVYDAHRHMETNKNKGKIILRLD